MLVVKNNIEKIKKVDRKKKVKKIGLYFGSFNPIHNGHLILANYIVQNAGLDELWFVVSRRNPLKSGKGLLDDRKRFALVQMAIEDNPLLKACDIEFYLPTPSYTVNTLAYLSDKHPDKEFHIIMGQDNIVTFNKWKNYETILEYYSIIVYPRPNTPHSDFLNHPNVSMVEAPQVEISSSLIRENIKQNKSVQYLLPDNVRQEIEKSNYYRD